MCSEKLRAHLRLVGTEKLPTYEAIRAEIADWLAKKLRNPAKQGSAAIGLTAEWEDVGVLTLSGIQIFLSSSTCPWKIWMTASSWPR